ncbi:MAG: hypothetical protein AABY09_02390 [Nanoarchaeota archaeon]
MNEQINSYVREGLSKGYTEAQLRKILEDNRVPATDIEYAFSYANGTMLEAAETQGKDHSRLYSWLLIIGGLSMMIAAYMLKIFKAQNAESATELSQAMMLLNGLWPLAFPIGANIANYRMFRKRFAMGLIFTIAIIVAIVGFVYLMDKISSAA